MMNKKVASEVAIGIIILVALLIGGIFYLQNKKIAEQSPILPEPQQNKTTENFQQNTQDEDASMENQQLLTTYKKVEINNPQLKFSFEVPDFWIVEKRNSGERQMTLEEKRDFLADVLNGDGEYADYTRADFNKMTAKEIDEFFSWGKGVIASVSKADTITYSDTSWSQIDFLIIDAVEAKKDIDGAQKSEDYEGIYYDKSGKPNKIGKPIVRNLKIANYDAILILYPTDINENGKELISKAGPGGQDIYVNIGNTRKFLKIRKQAKGEENDFQHLLETLKIENSKI